MRRYAQSLKMDEFVELGNHEFVKMEDDDQIVIKTRSLTGEIRKVIVKALAHTALRLYKENDRQGARQYCIKTL